MAASDAVITHCYEALRHLDDGSVYPKAQELAAHYGVAVQTVYRWVARKGLRWRKEKATKGTSRIPDATITKAGALLAASRRTNNQLTLPARDAKEILEDSGIDTGGVSASRFIARMREKKVSAADILRPAPHVRLLSDHPNHVWQFDVTNCIQYFLNDRKGMEERDIDMELYKNKIVRTARSIRKELLRYAVVDHCTGAFYFRYFYTSGERAIDGSTFLFEAMRPKDTLVEQRFNGSSAAGKGTYHFHGVPFVLVADRGSIATARANQALFDALRMKLETHLPGNPRAKGAIEGLMHITNAFEARLKFRRPSSLAELNAWALDWCINYCATRPMRGVAPRSALWSTITPDQLRLCPDAQLYKLLVKEPSMERTADGSAYISIDGRAYRVPDHEAANHKVTVIRHPYEYPAVEIHFNGFVWLCQPVERDRYGRLSDGVRYGEYKRPKDTETQYAAREMEQVSKDEWGLTWKGTGNHRRAEAPPVGHESPLQVFGHQADKIPEGVEYIQRRGTPLDVNETAPVANVPRSHSAFEIPRPASSRRISVADFLLQLAAEIGAIPREVNQHVKETYPDGVIADEVADIIEQIKQGRAAVRRTRPLSAVQR